MKPISDLIWNPEDNIMPADEQMSDDCHGGSGECLSFREIAGGWPDEPLFNMGIC